MVVRTDPFRELDRVASQLLGTVTGTPAHPNLMPMDAFDLDIERNVLTVKAERRPVGVLSRTLFLGESLDSEHIAAVPSVVADAAGEELMRRILVQLPPGFDLLFGRPEA